MGWDEVAKQIVHQAMQGYCAACGERSWFYEIDLIPALGNAAQAVTCTRGRTVDLQSLQDLVAMEYDEILERALFTKGIWQATADTFTDTNAQGKLNQALTRAYQVALDECLNDTKPLPDLQRVERFAKTWIDNTMHRAWTAVENSELLTEGSIVRLFHNLLQPFGKEHAFSCIPGILTEHIGPPPHDWQFIRVTVRELFIKWKQEALTGTTRKKRKTENGSAIMEENESIAGVNYEDDDDDAVEGPGKSILTSKASVTSKSAGVGLQHYLKQEAVDEEIKRHPECTSAEDCIGASSDKLVRHIIDDDMGDLYCESCWQSFLEQNPSLESVPV